MKFVYIANARIPTEKAHGYQIMKMCEEFSQNGFSVEFIVPTRKNKIKENPFVFYSIKENFKIREIRCFDFIGTFPKWGRFSFWFQNALFDICILFSKFEDDSVFYTRSAGITFILRMRGKKVFFESHRLLSARWIYKILLGKYAKVISLTKQAEKIYLELGLGVGNILVAPDAVDLNLFRNEIKKEEARIKLNLPKEKIILGYFGRFKTMGEDKGLLDILKSLSFLPQNVLLLAVGGSKDDIKFYEIEAEKMSVSKKVIFKETVPRNVLPDFEYASNVLLMPFPDTEHYRLYMSPLKMFEYMASNRPIIASDLPSVREVLNEKNAILVKPENPEELTKAIQKLIDNPALGEKLARQARLDVEDFTWEKRAERIKRFILEPIHYLNAKP